MAVSVRSSESFAFFSPVRLHFEKGAVDRLGELAPDAKRILIVTGRTSARKSGLLERGCSALGPRSVTVFDEVEPNPSIETAERGARLAADIGADLVVGLGGGSAMDAAKVIAALAPNSGSFREEFGKTSYSHPPIRLIEIPTTCGTGSETNPYAIITDTDAGDKANFSSPQTYPAMAILDPTVLEKIPREILITTALDAFTHALEGFTSRRAQPLAGALAIESMGLTLRHLVPAADGDAEGKANLLYASALAGIVIAHTGTTMLHAIGYCLTLRHQIPHGKANAILIPLLLEHLQGVIPQKVRTVLNLFPHGVRDNESVRGYLRRLGIATELSAHGVDPGEFDSWAEYVLKKRNTAATVGTVDRETLIGLLQRYA